MTLAPSAMSSAVPPRPRSQVTKCSSSGASRCRRGDLRVAVGQDGADQAEVALARVVDVLLQDLGMLAIALHRIPCGDAASATTGGF